MIGKVLVYEKTGTKRKRESRKRGNEGEGKRVKFNPVHGKRKIPGRELMRNRDELTKVQKRTRVIKRNSDCRGRRDERKDKM